MAKRKRSPTSKSASASPVPPGISVPSAQTLFRYHYQNAEAVEHLAQMTRQADPEVWDQKRESLERIERAGSAQELMDLLPLAIGLGSPLWQRRMRAFGPEFVPLLTARLKDARSESETVRTQVYEQVIAALRWKGPAGAAALVACFEDLDDYGKSLACIALGLLGARDCADLMWEFYQQTRTHTHERFFVGPLWGLIDLEDTRVADALTAWLQEGLEFDELFGFLSLTGGKSAAVYLLLMSVDERSNVQQQAAMALLSIAHRIGREALLIEFQRVGPETSEQQRDREAIVDDIMDTPPRRAEEYFAAFYRSLNDEDMQKMEQVLSEMQDRMAEFSLPSAASKLGRNDLCWCGSGKKYKRCHWRRDKRAQ